MGDEHRLTRPLRRRAAARRVSGDVHAGVGAEEPAHDPGRVAASGAGGVDGDCDPERGRYGLAERVSAGVDLLRGEQRAFDRLRVGLEQREPVADRHVAAQPVPVLQELIAVVVDLRVPQRFPEQAPQRVVFGVADRRKPDDIPLIAFAGEQATGDIVFMPAREDEADGGAG